MNSMFTAFALPAALVCACFVDYGVTSGPPPASTTSSDGSGGHISIGPGDAGVDTTGEFVGGTTTPMEPTEPTTHGTTTTTTTTTSDPMTTTGSTGPPSLTGDETDDTGLASSTGGLDACARDHVVNLDISEATLSRGVELSLLDNESVARGPTPGDTVTWTFNLPCADDWRLWVRYYQLLGDTSTYGFSYDLDADAMFDGGCGFFGAGMRWQLLNRRQPRDSVCTALIDPYLALLDAGAHSLTFSFTDAEYLGSAVITNDPSFSPI